MNHNYTINATVEFGLHKLTMNTTLERPWKQVSWTIIMESYLGDGLNSMRHLPWTLFTMLNTQTEDRELPKRVESSGQATMSSLMQLKFITLQLRVLFMERMASIIGGFIHS